MLPNKTVFQLGWVGLGWRDLFSFDSRKPEGCLPRKSKKKSSAQKNRKEKKRNETKRNETNRREEGRGGGIVRTSPKSRPLHGIALRISPGRQLASGEETQLFDDRRDTKDVRKSILRVGGSDDGYAAWATLRQSDRVGSQHHVEDVEMPSAGVIGVDQDHLVEVGQGGADGPRCRP